MNKSKNMSSQHHQANSAVGFLQRHPDGINTLLRDMIEDLKLGAGYNYTDIARFTALSPSEIQKLATGRRQAPKCPVYCALFYLYCKTFYGKGRISYAANFLNIKKHHTLDWLEEFLDS